MLVKLLTSNGKFLREEVIPSFDRRPDVIIFGNRCFMFAHETLVKNLKHYVYRECELFNMASPDRE